MGALFKIKLKPDLISAKLTQTQDPNSKVVGFVKGIEFIEVWDTPLESEYYKVAMYDSDHKFTNKFGYLSSEVCEDSPAVWIELPENVVSSDGPDDSAVEMTEDNVYKLLEDQLKPTISNSYTISKMDGICAAPYQFMESVDRRLKDTDIGRKYAERIVTRMPLLFLSPGKINFAPAFRKNEKAGIITYLISGGDSSNELQDIINGKNGRYYTFDFAFNEYYKYVNTMMRSGAVYLGIENVVISMGDYKKDLKHFQWDKAALSDLSKNGFVTGKEFIAFYMDSSSSVDESFSNTTTSSQLSNIVNSASDVGREVSFLLGAGAGVEVDFLKNEGAISQTLETIDSIADKYLGKNQLFKDLAANFATVASGGKLLFPEIWEDSEFSKNYSISFKLRTPDGDKLSWYLNIYYPLTLLICMTAPLQSPISVNGYLSPFLVRAYYKGLFNCSMGMITNLGISKGKDSAWTLDGLPTEVDVSVDIKDLYQLITLSSSDSPTLAAQNTCYMDYIANSCGVNINIPDVQRALTMYSMLYSNKVLDIPNNIWTKTQENFSNKMMTLYSSFFRDL